MLRAEYIRVPFNAWGVLVRGAVAPGDKVHVPRPDGTVHYHTIQEVFSHAGSERVCIVVPVTSERIKEVYHAD